MRDETSNKIEPMLTRAPLEKLVEVLGKSENRKEEQPSPEAVWSKPESSG